MVKHHWRNMAALTLLGLLILPFVSARAGSPLSQHNHLPLISRALTHTPPPPPPPSRTATMTQMSPTPTVTPSATSTPEGTATPGLPSGWLARLNYHRALAGLPTVTENAEWNNGCWLHARYAVKNDLTGHTEDSSRPWYTLEGLACAQSANLFYAGGLAFSDEYAVDYLMLLPFHGLGFVDPRLQVSGFGSYREEDGGIQMSAAVDVIRGIRWSPPPRYPVMWPTEGALVPFDRFPGGEYPNPLTSCPGFSVPAGLPLLLQLGTGSITPQVTAHGLTKDGVALEHCVFDETTYVNPDAAAQSTGRAVLGARDAIVLLPRTPLEVGETYTASLTANGQTYTWSFTVTNNLPTLNAQEASRVEAHAP